MKWATILCCGYLGVFVVSAVGCSGNNASGSEGDFVADNPGGGDGRGDGNASGGGEGTDSGGDFGGGDDGGREIAEADIVQIEGERLYALSRYSGLTIIDVSQDTALPVLGRWRAHGFPFEMYVDGGQVFVMLSDHGSYTWDEALGGYGWHTSSKLVALDASAPEAVAVRGEFEVPGSIQDSRRVGEVLYVVTYEDGYCWGCKDSPNTTVTALDVSDPAQVRIVDQLTFEGAQHQEWGWSGPRSVSATDERMYVGGIEYSDAEVSRSIIDVIDISDPAGTMVKGASIEVAGAIQNRWQMDEYEGVLRVVSQPFQWWGGDRPPVVETFSVGSASDVVPLASLDMQLPRPESLQSVRFDGLRAYAITFEQVDPLFTLDLSDPAAPVQVGELEIPGFVYHMEPRGDRLLAVGFDRGHPDGAINVSLFDVSDLADPQLMSRVHFGGDWAGFAEDQNRIHKAFSIFDDLGLLSVPFWGWSATDDWGCNSTYESGIQLIDWANDALTLRGVAPAQGQSRRALIHAGDLLGMSDKSVERFDISNRDAPTELAQLSLAANVSQIGFGEGIAVRLAQDWWTNETTLEVVSSDEPDTAMPLGRLSLNDLSTSHPWDDYECGYSGLYSAEIFVHGGYTYLVHEYYDLQGAQAQQRTRIDVFDVRSPAAPVHVNTVDLPFARSWHGGYASGIALPEQHTMVAGVALVMVSGTYIGDGPTSTSAFEIIDLGDPENPAHSASLARPDALAHGGLQAFGNAIASWHMRAANDDASKVRFYLERIDVANPNAPQQAQPINVPGVVAAYDPASRRAVTIDHQLEAIDLTEEACWQQTRVQYYDANNSRCWIAHRDLKLVRLEGDSASLLDTLAVEGDDSRIQAVAGSPDRVFVQLQRGAWYGSEFGPEQLPRQELAVVTGLGGDTLDEASRVAVGDGGWWYGDLQALGTRAVFSTGTGLGVLDATDPAATAVEMHDLYGYGCWNIEIEGTIAYCPMGEYGLQVIPLQ